MRTLAFARANEVVVSITRTGEKERERKKKREGKKEREPRSRQYVFGAANAYPESVIVTSFYTSIIKLFYLLDSVHRDNFVEFVYI